MLQRLLLLRDVAAGMEFLHSKNIVHSDLVKGGGVHSIAARSR
jgi:serine/threonine protein kinase